MVTAEAGAEKQSAAVVAPRRLRIDTPRHWKPQLRGRVKEAQLSSIVSSLETNGEFAAPARAAIIGRIIGRSTPCGKPPSARRRAVVQFWPGWRGAACPQLGRERHVGFWNGRLSI